MALPPGHHIDVCNTIMLCGMKDRRGTVTVPDDYGVELPGVQNSSCSSWLLCLIHNANWRHMPACLSADGLMSLLSLSLSLKSLTEQGASFGCRCCPPLSSFSLPTPAPFCRSRSSSFVVNNSQK